MSGRWFLTTSADEPGRLKVHWMKDSDFEDFGIKGEVGEEYHVLDDESDPKSRIVGEIRGKMAEYLDMLVAIIDTADESGVASQELRYNNLNVLVQSVVRAYERARA